MKKNTALLLALLTCIALPSCSCRKKKQKTTKVTQKELVTDVEVIETHAIKEVADITVKEAAEII